MRLDLVLVFGYAGVLGMILAGLTLSHGSIREIWSAEGFVMAFGGSLAGTMAALSWADIRNIPKILKVAFTVRAYDYDRLINDFSGYAAVSRKEGILALEKVASQVTDPFLQRALQMAVDGVDPEQIHDRLSTEMGSIEERHKRSRAIFDMLSVFSPAFGMIGTIMGLVLVLKSLDDPKQLGPRMSVALLSTFFGVFACYGLYTPLAKKLERKHKDEALYRDIIVKGITAIQSGDSPKVVISKMKVFLQGKKE